MMDDDTRRFVFVGLFRALDDDQIQSDKGFNVWEFLLVRDEDV